MPLVEAAYLLGYLYEIGPDRATHEELRAWQANTGIRLGAWEVRTVHQLAEDYLAQARQSIRLDCPAPWTDSPVEIDIVGASLRDSLRELTQL